MSGIRSCLVVNAGGKQRNISTLRYTATTCKADLRCCKYLVQGIGQMKVLLLLTQERQADA